MRTTSRTRWEILLALAMLVAAGGAGAGKNTLPPLPAGGQTIGGPGKASIPGPGTSQFWARFDDPVPACVTIVVDVDAVLFVRANSGDVDRPAPAGMAVTVCRPDLLIAGLDCDQASGCRVVWRIDQLEETIR